LGTDYNFECKENGILVTSEDSSFVLTDRAKNIEKECKGTVNRELSKISYVVIQVISKTLSNFCSLISPKLTNFSKFRPNFGGCPFCVGASVAVGDLHVDVGRGWGAPADNRSAITHEGGG